MKVLQIAPIALPISPNLGYGGIERAIWHLDNQLVRKGVESQIAAPGNSDITGKLLPTLEKDVFSHSEDLSEMRNQYEKHAKKTKEYIDVENPDVVHDHNAGFLLNSDLKVRDLGKPFVSTFHVSDIDEGMIDRWKHVSQERWDGTRFVSISNSQKRRLEDIMSIPIHAVVYHGLDVSEFPYSGDREEYLFSVGKIAPEKGQDLAIQVAKTTGNSLILAGPVQNFVPQYVKYYNKEVKPHINHDLSKNNGARVSQAIELAEKEKGDIIYVGSVNDKERNLLNQYAKCYLMPQRWAEGFGLVMIEAMACGNPVIAFNRGSIPEIVDHRKNGYIVENEHEMAEMVDKIKDLNPSNCRQSIEDRFNLEQNVKGYMNVYSDAIRGY